VEQPDFFASGPPGLAFVNGFAKLGAGRVDFEAHSPEHRARYAFPFAYDPAAPRARWLACLADAFQGDDDAADKIECLQEFAGAALFGLATKYQKAIVMFGEGANAKSTIANVIAAAFPAGSTCAVAPQTWGNEYRLAMMAGKLLNVVNELPEADILSGEDFKSMIDGSPKTARRIREAPFTFSARAGHLFAANKLPGSNDQSHGFWRRFIVLTFHRVFAEHEQNPNLADEIIRDELPGVVAWMVEGAKRIMVKGHYTIPASSAAAVASWRCGTDPVALFIEEKTRPAKAGAERTRSADLFAAYRDWSETNAHKVMSRSSFGRRMTAIKLGSVHTMTGEVYPVTLLRFGEQNPRDVERAVAEQAAREATDQHYPDEDDPLPAIGAPSSPPVCAACEGSGEAPFRNWPAGTYAPGVETPRCQVCSGRGTNPEAKNLTAETAERGQET
jgi:putative DNA primase/helicase